MPLNPVLSQTSSTIGATFEETPNQRVRRLIRDTLNADELMAFVSDFYPEWYDEIDDVVGFMQKVTWLIQHCTGEGAVLELEMRVKRYDPYGRSGTIAPGQMTITQSNRDKISDSIDSLRDNRQPATDHRLTNTSPGLAQVPVQELQRLVKIAQPLIAEDNVARHQRAVGERLGQVRPPQFPPGAALVSLQSDLSRLGMAVRTCCSVAKQYKLKVLLLRQDLLAGMDYYERSAEMVVQALDDMEVALASVDDLIDHRRVATDVIDALIEGDASGGPYPQRLNKLNGDIQLFGASLGALLADVEAATQLYHETLFNEVMDLIKALQP